MSSLSGTIYRCAGASDVGGGQLARPSALPSPCIGLLVAAELSLSVSRRSRVVRCWRLLAFSLSFFLSFFPLLSSPGSRGDAAHASHHPIIKRDHVPDFPVPRQTTQADSVVRTRGRKGAIAKAEAGQQYST